MIDKIDSNSFMDRINSLVDELEIAIEIKEHDLLVEGHLLAPENHYKLGILRASDSLIRRARALMEDYGTDLEYDIDPTNDEEAAVGEDFEETDVSTSLKN